MSFNIFQVYQYFTIHFCIKICTIFMNILYNTLLTQEVPKTILGR